MLSTRVFGLACAVAVFVCLVAAAVSAQPIDKRTLFTFSGPVTLPGVTLEDMVERPFAAARELRHRDVGPSPHLRTLTAGRRGCRRREGRIEQPPSEVVGRTYSMG
jgi:hypothetical protein